MTLVHGGRLNAFAAQYQTPVEDWLDLSTGVSPFTYPCPPVPERVWNRLPETNDGLEPAAAAYYGCDSLMAVAGSQAAIMALPAIITRQRLRTGVVALPRIGYKEHQQAWQSFAGAPEPWQLIFYDGLPTEQVLARADVVVMINPNNPSGRLISFEEMTLIADRLAGRGALLIVDEAFMDCTPVHSLLNQPLAENVIVLRSLGKFFGLAGARVGFVMAQPAWLERLAVQLGPWTLSGPSRWIAKTALADIQWQHRTRQQIHQLANRLRALLSQCFPQESTGTDLFQRVRVADAQACHHQLCQQQILVRLCDEGDTLRFGVPGDETGWQRLSQALHRLDFQGKA